MKQTTINIDTETWVKIIAFFKKERWDEVFSYNGFDRRIDFDLLILSKHKDEILFGWDNWFEGEIQCSNKNIELIKKEFNLEFKFGQPNSLKESVVEIYRK
jgi:hypothetical protein